MVARCSLCDELITANNPGQFFPEDDSHICAVCRREHQNSLEEMKKRASRKSVTVMPALAIHAG